MDESDRRERRAASGYFFFGLLIGSMFTVFVLWESLGEPESETTFTIHDFRPTGDEMCLEITGPGWFCMKAEETP